MASDTRQDLIVISAGASGRELHGFACALEARGADWRVKGFLDDRAGLLEGLGYEHPILDAVESYEPQENDRFVCAIGDPAERRRYTELILDRGGRLANLVHWTSLCSPRIDAGLGGHVVGPFCTMTSEIKVAHSVHFSSHVVVGHDVEIGAYCQLQAFAFVGGGARLGEGVTIQPHGVVLAGARIGDGAVVGAGSVAMRKVAANTTVFGVPAMVLPFGKKDADN